MMLRFTQKNYYHMKRWESRTVRVAFLCRRMSTENEMYFQAPLCLRFSWCCIYTKNFLFTSFSLPFSELSLVGCGWLTIVLHCYDIVGWVSKMTYDVSSGTLNPTRVSHLHTNKHPQHTLLKTYYLCYTVECRCMRGKNMFLTVMCLEYWALSHCVPAKVQKW